MRAFYEVVCTGSIRRASERLNTSPSSVSRQIALLEHEIGTALFDREATGMTPTHAGRLVAEYARSVVLDYDGLRADLNDLKGDRRALRRGDPRDPRLPQDPARGLVQGRGDGAGRHR
jgi:DNA-binding transcriptional LysR family regulator